MSLKHYSTYSDEQLFEQFCRDKKNRNDIFTEIYNRYSARIYNYCVHLTGNIQDASDITQETFIKFYQHTEFQTHSSLSGYLYKCARNQAFALLRNKKEKTSLDDEEIEIEENTFENKDLSELINLAIEKLPFALKEIFILRYIQGLNYNEISAITMTNQATLRTKVYRALGKIQKLLEPHFKEIIKEKNR